MILDAVLMVVSEVQVYLRVRRRTGQPALPRAKKRVAGAKLQKLLAPR
jgi:hypothetical protein